MEKTGSKTISFLEVDLESLASVRDLAEKLKTLKRIDILINNAGISFN